MTRVFRRNVEWALTFTAFAPRPAIIETTEKA
jgi:hypothetical protein